jgi:hypothetical protein
MAQTIATISLCLFIIIVQHLYNWGMRKIIDMMGQYSFGPGTALTTIMIGLSFLLFKLLIEINK